MIVQGDELFSLRSLPLREALMKTSVTSYSNPSKSFDRTIELVSSGILSKDTALQRSVTIIESEISDSELEDDTDDASLASTWSHDPQCLDVIRNSFETSFSQWIDDPIIKQWREADHPIHRTIAALDRLHQDWRSRQIGPFSPATDKIWLEVGHVLAEVGLPWHNNEINMPDEIDTSWPFHFKSFEIQVMRAKGSRVGDPNPSGYVCNWAEANCYGIRALQQELREKHPRQPLLVYDHIDDEIVRSSEKLFGLESCHIDLSKDFEDVLAQLKVVTNGGARPIIFAATLASTSGESDQLKELCRLSECLPIILHIDASRNFDYITTLTEHDREMLGIEKFTLGIRSLDKSLRLADGSILASTIIAGGSNHVSPAPVVALKPLALGSVPHRVAYTRASDSTLAGSRDALAPLWVALQEIRFGAAGFQRVYEYCAKLRKELVGLLEVHGVTVLAPTYSLDIIVEYCSELQIDHLTRLGGIQLDTDQILLTLQPSVRPCDVYAVVNILLSAGQKWSVTDYLPNHQNFSDIYPVPANIVRDLINTVQSWKVATRSAAGYPFHMGSYSALGPVIGNFLDINIPQVWINSKAKEVLEERLVSFGLSNAEELSLFKAAFTNGSTMGNRVGIHTALTHFPGAFLYFSSETHYSVPKTARDCDQLTNRWSERSGRYSEIASHPDGSIHIEKLVQQALLDQAECRGRGETYHLVLFLNMGTTFVGARDNLAEIRRQLSNVEIEIAYIHVDGALDFGFHDCDIALGPPGMMLKDGLPVVQGVTLSHHKAMGNMVSGEVLCYSPGSQMAALGSGVDPRAIFETWLYLQVYTKVDLIHMFDYCRDNASRLEVGLEQIGVVTKRNRDSTIVVLERPPAWVTEEFSLRPQDDWVHFITMPHISPATVDLFVDRIGWVDRQCEVAFRYVEPLLHTVFKQPLMLQRVQCRSKLAQRVTALAQSLVQPTDWYYESIDDAIRSSLRGAMSIVATDEDGNPQAVFLAESTRDRTIRAGPVLCRSQFSGSRRMILDIGRQLIGFVARHLDARLETDDMSFMFLSLL